MDRPVIPDDPRKGEAPDAAAFGRDLVALVPNLRRFALSLCRSRDVADDLVQATCERALAGRAGFTPGTRMDAWLFRILRNLWIDRHRKTTAEGVSESLDDGPDLAGEDGAHVVETRLMLDATGRAILRLPPERREVLLLVCVEDLSYREAAEVLGVPIGTVMSRLARARLDLAADLGINPPGARSPGEKGSDR